MRLLYIAGWGYVATAAATLMRGPVELPYAAHAPVARPIAGPAGWFASVRAHCNPVEVEVELRSNPAPAGWEGQAYGAACYALAGKISRARAIIDALDASERVQAAGIVFDVCHPVADAGDDESAGPMMQLVVEYWPNHYMALYHAGMAHYRTGKLDQAKAQLEAFLREYRQDDGWTSSARDALAAIRRGAR